MPEVCAECGERKVVFMTASKWRCKACGTYFDWSEVRDQTG